MSALPPPHLPAAGWYPDPAGPGRRYFDGRAWAPPAPQLDDAVGHPNLPLTVALGALGILTASLVVGKLVIDALVDRGWPLAVYIAISVLVSYGPSVAWGLRVRRRWGAGRLDPLGWRFRWSDLGWGPLTWFAAVVSQLLVTALVLWADVPLSSNVDPPGTFDRDRAYLAATLLAAVIAAPVVEEVVFRGLVLRGLLSRMGAVPAVVVQGVLFGLAHADPTRGRGNIGLVIVLSAVGIALGAAAFFTRRLGPSVIAHAIFNAIVFVIVLVGQPAAAERGIGVDARSAAVEHPVVDQAHLAEPGGHQHHGGSVDHVEWPEVGDVDHRDVLESGGRLGGDAALDGLSQHVGTAFAGGVGGGTGGE